MRRARRHKYLQISVFFLIYSIIHVVSLGNSESGDKQESENSDKSIKKHAGHAFLTKSAGNHMSSSTGKKIDTTTEGDSKTHNSLDETVEENTQTSPSGSATDTTPTIHPGHHAILNILTKHGHGSLGKTTTTASSKEAHPVVIEKTIDQSQASFGKNAPTKTEGYKHAAKSATQHIHGAFGKMNITNENATAEDKCIQPAIQQFPHPIMSPSTRRHGGIIIHIIVAAYMFLGLAIVCDEYFVASLDRICEELKMSPDVAGATFMAAGSSAPELATVIIGVFFAKDDIGLSGVIGSAVFNIMFVIACCGLCTTTVVYLNWWPLVRDCTFYAISILLMLIVIYDKKISWVESLMMLLTYVIYCVVLHFNTYLERWAQTLPVPFKHTAPTEESGLVSYKTLDDDGKPPNYGMEWSPDKPQGNGEQGFANQLSGPALNQATTDVPPSAQPPPPPPGPIKQDYYRPKEYDPATQVNPLDKPDGGLYAKTVWAIVYPIHWLCRKSMPNCRTEKYKNWYPFTFCISMIWISFYSYFMVWMITIIGYTLGIPDTVMGLTFVAAGVSVPDALSSVAVIKEGYGDMAVSNAVGSNVFDILICLGLPWFIKTAIINPGNEVDVISKGLPYSTLSLLSTVVCLLLATHLNGWKLDRRFGIILMVWYLIFITFASMYELNIFGNMNPVECSSTW